jgi:predicted O-linked N-acetylglucosamine transferase (SPINDLY family)
MNFLALLLQCLRLLFMHQDHPTAHLMQSIGGFHNRDKVEVFMYSLAPSDASVYHDKISREAEHFVDVSGESLVTTDAAARQ